MNILILSDDKYHPGSVVKSGLAFLEEKHNITWAESVDNLELKDFKLIILSKSNHRSSTDHEPWMDERVEKEFLNYVESGGKLFVIHSGTADYNNFMEFKNLIGGLFNHHPKQCLVTYKHIKKEPFTVLDEHYFMDMSNEKLDIFMTSHSDHGEQPAGWSRSYGKGMVYTITPGHNLDVWLNKINRSIIEEIIQ